MPVKKSDIICQIKKTPAKDRMESKMYGHNECLWMCVSAAVGSEIYSAYTPDDFDEELTRCHKEDKKLFEKMVEGFYESESFCDALNDLFLHVENDGITLLDD